MAQMLQLFGGHKGQEFVLSNLDLVGPLSGEQSGGSLQPGTFDGSSFESVFEA